mmetsp:Transcript_67232/g.161120  ORF Transcript_67232/g.161120 Transcript_67232/m.161120 type:complete len:80 (+) Transcript_67232:453-692(+)
MESESDGCADGVKWMPEVSLCERSSDVAPFQLKDSDPEAPDAQSDNCDDKCHGEEALAGKSWPAEDPAPRLERTVPSSC